MLTFAPMRFGKIDIWIVSFIGAFTGCYIMKVGRSAVDHLPFAPYIVLIAGLLALLGVRRMLRPLLEQRSGK
jgi:uncharacterized membrane protein